MKFRTEIEIPRSPHSLDYSSKILSLGSCFAHSIGGKLKESKFDIAINPAGVLFNPLSIVSTIERLEQGQKVEAEELQQRRGGWFHFDFHSSLSSLTAEQTLEQINAAVELGSRSLAQCDTIIVTLGTVWIYEFAESGRVVANCHKEPSSRFTRRAMSLEEVEQTLVRIVEKYPSKRFIFSVSPIRHLADGLPENSLSKATLRVAIARVVESHANACYFPAYELLVDDLRDYRFYADDMMHPSTMAVEYIWQKFAGSYISDEARSAMQSVANIVRAASHRAFNPTSAAHQDFCRKQLELIKELPEIDFGKENAYFMSQLQKKL